MDAEYLKSPYFSEIEIAKQVYKILVNIPEPIREYIIQNIAPNTVNRWAKLMLNNKGDGKYRWLNGFDNVNSIVNIIKPLMEGEESLEGLELAEFQEYQKEIENNPCNPKKIW